jgi:hypothetical protein
MACAQPNVTLCPPSSSFIHFAPHQFVRPNRPVAVRYLGGDRWESTGLSFDDALSCQKTSKKMFASRRFVTPAWAISNTKLQKVICGYLIQRAHGHSRRRPSMPKGMKPLEMLRYAEQLLLQKVPAQERVITTLCEDYVSMKEAGVKHPYVRTVEALISNYDTSIIINRSAGKIVAAVVYGYYREGLSSVGIAEATGLRPPCVRQILFRVWQVAKKLGYDVEPAREQKNSTTVFKDEYTGELIEAVRPKRAEAALANAADIRKVDDRWSAENLAAYRAKKATVEKKPTRAPDRIAIAASRAERADFVAQYRAQNAPVPNKPRASNTRQRWVQSGLCRECGREKEETELKSCNACRERRRIWNIPRLAAAKVERAKNPVPKEVWRAHLSESQRAAWAKKRKPTHSSSAS